MKKILLLLTIFTYSSILFANGIIRGTIIDKSSGEPIVDANVLIKGTLIGTTTDFDGNYSLKAPEGTHTIIISLIGYSKIILQNVLVTNDKVSLLDASLSPAEQLQEIVLTASIKNNTASALITMQKKSVKLLDGISFEAISKNGDSNVAAAIKRVTGISVEEGKYIYVRGLSDRYTKTTLNGMSIPGLDPDKNTVQMDLFPTNLIDNLIVYKTFSPDLPGDFTGGLVDISTKDFPRRKTFVIGIGIGYNPSMNLDKNYITYQKGNMDWLGFGGNSRKLNFNSNTHIPDESLNDPKLTELTKSFSKELGVSKGTSLFLDNNFSISFGNQYEKENVIRGLNLAFNYATSYTFYNDVKQGVFYKDTDFNVNKLDRRETTTGSLSKNNIIWSALLGGALKYDYSKYSASLFHSQNGNGQAADYISNNYDSTNATLYKDGIQYSQKSITNLILKGNHHLSDDKYTVDWKISPTYSKILEPDVRSTKLSYDEATDTFSLQFGDGAGIDRYFRTLNEINVAAKIDLTYKFKFLNDKKSKLKLGISNTFKNRDYKILEFSIDKTNDFNSFTEDPNTILQDNHIWNASSQSGVYVRGFQNLDNQYTSYANIMAGYIMNEVKLTKNLKTIYGVRVENAKINYDGYFQNKTFNEIVHDETVILPSLNLIYATSKKSNLRLSFSKTVARPSFKEKSNATITDPISNTVFIGNIDLKETNVDNIDVRWESFFSRRQMFSISGFYKDFTNPIELVPFELSPNNIQPRNTNNAIVYGGEIEIKKDLTNNDVKMHINVSVNFTYLVSKVDTEKVIVNTNGRTEFDIRKDNKRTEETVSKFRSMQGQSPYIINGSLNFYNDRFNANVSYNVQGEKLAIVGSGIVPDVFEDPFNSLNLKVSYKFGKENKSKLSFSAKNLLNDNFEQFFESFKAENQIYRSYGKGQLFSLSYSYKIN